MAQPKTSPLDLARLQGPKVRPQITSRGCASHRGVHQGTSVLTPKYILFHHVPSQVGPMIHLTQIFRQSGETSHFFFGSNRLKAHLLLGLQRPSRPWTQAFPPTSCWYYSYIGQLGSQNSKRGPQILSRSEDLKRKIFPIGILSKCLLHSMGRN